MKVKLERVQPNGLQTSTGQTLGLMKSKVAKLSLTGTQSEKANVFLAQYSPALRTLQPRPLVAAVIDLERKLGITEARRLSQSDMVELIGTIRRIYGGLTISDMSEAVNLLLSESLSKPDGKVISPSSHYQNLCEAFVCEWLNAYKRYKANAIKQIRELLPYEYDQASESEKEQIEVDMRETAIQAIEDFKDGGTFYVIAYPEVYEYLEERGIFTLDNKRKWDCYKRAKGKVNNRIKAENDRNAMKIAANPHLKQVASETMYKREARALAFAIAVNETTDILEKI